MNTTTNTATSTVKSVGIIGAGAIGQAIAKQLVRAGIDVILSNSRGPASLAGAVDALGPHATAGTPQQAAQADIVFVSVNWSRLEEALAGIDWTGRIVIDANNPVLLPGYRLAELGGRNSSQVFASLVPGARVVKAFNTLLAAVLASDPHEGGGRRVVFQSGDDREAKAVVAGLIERLGFAGIDLGSLEVGGALQQFPGGVLPAVNLVKLG
ncbi:NADPH-dependent F420 reductase [Pseudoduganella albidiflava]|uniref:NADP oxidoreductase n=1 Tax=Pseudoduganella albidiflava TaxID=321983 RepID=A0A411WVP1_9BURK|nr:NADPH-dependent F420 reductase [Pseudoduganella albidiflava]QBI00820.1 NADP oxidoreductase [Pseudoduganella albidiflava]GGY30497.1 NADP oxidoreductase [Pseudoduganella albidiflava]